MFCSKSEIGKCSFQDYVFLNVLNKKWTALKCQLYLFRKEKNIRYA